ncbi:MAG: enoyl-CoA hydratase/isomerase family protein [Calditrichaeota bacterium]|nr:MAG: enoyl-CoA hydratase/isomerase family protein [Calditrichota bacterium]
MSGNLVEYRVENGIAIMELNNPPANSYNHEMMAELDACVVKARFDESVHVLLITGKGDKFFSGGADINMLQSNTPAYLYNFGLHGNETLLRIENTPKLVIAAINGHAMGGGCEISMACDIRIAKKGKAKIGLPEVNLGVLPGMGGTQRLARLVGPAKAIEIMATGRALSVDEALAIGLVNQVFDEEGYWDSVMEYARGFVPPKKASLSVGLIKRAVKSGSEMSLADGLALERELLQRVFDSEDSQEGLKAYIEKRAANFTGK